MRRISISALFVGLCAVPGLAEAAAPEASEAASTETAEHTEAWTEPAPGLPDSAWQAMVDQQVSVVKHDGSEVSGRLAAVDNANATVVKTDGLVVSVARADVATLRAATVATAEVAPQPELGPAPAAPLPADQPRRKNWAIPGAIVGLSLSTVAFGLAIGSEVTREDQIPSLPMGVTATLMFAASVPIINAGSRSARRAAGVRGNVGMRVAGWVLYGLTLTDAAVLVGLGVSEVTAPPGVITSVALLGITSTGLAAGEAIIAGKQARTSTARLGGRPRLSLGATPLRAHGRTTGGMVALGGRF